MNNGIKPHIKTTLYDYKAYESLIREDAQGRGVENTRLSIYGIYMAVVEKQDADLAALRSQLATVTAKLDKAESKNRFLSGVISGMENAENEKLEQVTAEREAMREVVKQLEWITDKETGIQSCAICGAFLHRGRHFDDCTLAAALKGGKG